MFYFHCYTIWTIFLIRVIVNEFKCMRLNRRTSYSYLVCVKHFAVLHFSTAYMHIWIVAITMTGKYNFMNILCNPHVSIYNLYFSRTEKFKVLFIFIFVAVIVYAKRILEFHGSRIVHNSQFVKYRTWKNMLISIELFALMHTNFINSLLANQI